MTDKVLMARKWFWNSLRQFNNVKFNPPTEMHPDQRAIEGNKLYAGNMGDNF